MDRDTIIAVVLITAIMIVWMMMMPSPPPPEPVEEVTEQPMEEVTQPPNGSQEEQFVPDLANVPATATPAQTAREITVETDLYTARLSDLGATLKSFELKEYFKYDQVSRVQLIDSTSPGAISVGFQSPGARNIDTRTILFTQHDSTDTINAVQSPATVVFEAAIGSGRLRLTYTFTPGDYEVGLEVAHFNAAGFQTAEGYELVWNGAIPFSEDVDYRKEEVNKVGAYARSGNDVEGINLQRDQVADRTLRGNVSWVGVKNKYFGAVVLADDPAREAELLGERLGEVDDPEVTVDFRASLFVGPPDEAPDTYRIYLGPLEYRKISRYDGVYGMVDYGWDAFEWMTRPLAIAVFIPVFGFLSSIIESYGLVIIVFCLLIKVVLLPLTLSSYKSMAKMRELQPKMQEIKEKYPDNPQKQQEATIKMYRESGTNPLGACLPMLLQYPIIIALWQFLQQSIEIRQQGFLWAPDLSAPDVILNLSFAIPFYGDFVAGFTILMGLSMIVQMRMQATPASGPQAKIFMYMMPVMIFVFFNRLPSGLSLYYFCFNVFSAVQQQFINKSMKKKAASEKTAVKKSSKIKPVRGVVKGSGKKARK
ncbi:MAG: membrane protein insertase YidC [Rhodothermaceae bacterium]|nr:membrane protein insertase YidC [Rhodothermaceae bacterium]MYG45729.1 membrane protein insertase YidC [Rhodothermaceae bacterium]MYK63149.1 membrane protein insertase YidC [Rhodothermaceae bacterium]